MWTSGGEVDGWPMVGFIMMVDEFRMDNGATRFVPGSPQMAKFRPTLDDTSADNDGQVLACGPAGSMVIYNGSVWHGNSATRPVTRVQSKGSYVRRDAERPSTRRRIRPETLGRIGHLARFVLAV